MSTCSWNTFRFVYGQGWAPQSPDTLFFLNELILTETHRFAQSDLMWLNVFPIANNRLLLFRRFVTIYFAFFLEVTVNISLHCVWKRQIWANDILLSNYASLVEWRSIQMEPFASSLLLANLDLLQMTDWFFNNVTRCELNCFYNLYNNGSLQQ